VPDVQHVTVARSPLFRVGRSPDPFSPPDWRFARPDGTFGGRFDDPRSRHGVPPQGRYRVLYFASQTAAAYAETVAQFRPSLRTLSQLSGRNSQGLIPRDWRINRRLGTAVLTASLPFADAGDAETVQTLRSALAPVASGMGLSDIDLSVVAGPWREFTQEVALHLFTQRDAAGQPMYAGIRYVSRINHQWECWAAFADRIGHLPLRVDVVAADDPHLYEAARILGLAIEDDRGGIITPL